VKRRVGAFPIWILVILTGCEASWGQAKPDPAKPAAEATAPTPAPGKAPTEGAGVAVDPNKYVIGSEDVLFIRTWREPDFTLAVVVRPDGKITMPLIGELEASALTPQQLTNNIKEQLSKYMTNPDVNVFVQEVRSKKYYIDGEVNRPGPYPLITPIRIFEALSNASGFKDFANQKDIRILRGDKVLHFNYKDVTRGKHLEQNVYVENGDHIIVR
jgi:polysaccharide biosynthesis/export protein